MIVGVWLMLISYTDLAQLKTGKGKDDGIFGAGCALIFLSIILLIIAPNFEAYRSYKKQDGNENGTLSLILEANKTICNMPPPRLQEELQNEPPPHGPYQ